MKGEGKALPAVSGVGSDSGGIEIIWAYAWSARIKFSFVWKENSSDGNPLPSPHHALTVCMAVKMKSNKDERGKTVPLKSATGISEAAFAFNLRGLEINAC